MRKLADGLLIFWTLILLAMGLHYLGKQAGLWPDAGRASLSGAQDEQG